MLIVKTIRYKKLLGIGLFIVFGFTVCASRLSEAQSQAALAAPAYKTIPLAELKSRHYESDLLQRLLKGGI